MDWSRVWEHFTIVAIASVFTILLGLLLGFTAHLNRRAGKVILAVVDVNKREPEDVAREWLVEQGLLKG